MKTHLLKTSQGIALEINGVVSDCKLEFSEEVSKGIGELWGIFDVEKLACSYANYPYPLPYGYTGAANDFKNGFQAAQRLNKEKLFTMEDMEKAIDFGLSKQYYVSADSFNSIREGFVSSLLPERVECTVEMEEINTPFGSGLQPKITDGKIKVLTLIK